MEFLKILMIGLFMVSAPLALTACGDEDPLEEGIEEIGDEIDDATTN